MKNKLILPLVVITLIFAGCKSSKSGKTADKVTVPGVHFTDSETLPPILEQAALQNKLIFVDFYTTWCLPCKLMDEEVFTDKNIARFFNDNFINYKINGEDFEGVNLVLQYEVRAYPTLLFLDMEGKVIERRVGAAMQTDLMEMAQRAIETQRAGQ